MKRASILLLAIICSITAVAQDISKKELRKMRREQLQAERAEALRQQQIADSIAYIQHMEWVLKKGSTSIIVETKFGTRKDAQDFIIQYYSLKGIIPEHIDDAHFIIRTGQLPTSNQLTYSINTMVVDRGKINIVITGTLRFNTTLNIRSGMFGTSNDLGEEPVECGGTEGSPSRIAWDALEHLATHLPHTNLIYQ